MAGSLETAKSYLGSVAERTVGINAYQRWQRFLGPAEPESLTRDPLFRAGTYAEPIVIPGLQIAIPRITDLVADIVTGRMPDNIPAVFSKIYSSTAIDMATWYVAVQGDNLWEIIALKFAANAATHVALGLGSAAINRLKTFRPSATTLAV